MDDLARDYVTLVLSVGRYDSDYVDTYYGPPALKDAADKAALGLDALAARAAAMAAQLDDAKAGQDPLEALRHEYLGGMLSALRARVRMLQGERLSFDDESRALYDAVAPTYPEAHFQAILEELERRFPGRGPLVERYDRWRRQFIIPREKLDPVFRTAIAAGRGRTDRYMELPPGEEFTLEYVTNKAWSGYNWYQGNFRSLIQINTDLPIYIDRAVDLACHEGYPGHHVYHAQIEHHLVNARGWIEFTVYPLFSPQSLVAEGTANFGIEVAFPGAERATFERETLFPMASLDGGRAEDYYATLALIDRLSYAGNEAARKYLDGEIDGAAATLWLERYAMMPHERAAQRVRFFDQYRSYVINYNLGKDMVRTYIERRGGTLDRPEARWREFAALISSPRLPSGLR